MTPPSNATVTSIEISFSGVPELCFPRFLLARGFIDQLSPESVISGFIHDAVSSGFVNLSEFDP